MQFFVNCVIINFFIQLQLSVAVMMTPQKNVNGMNVTKYTLQSTDLHSDQLGWGSVSLKWLQLEYWSVHLCPGMSASII